MFIFRASPWLVKVGLCVTTFVSNKINVNLISYSEDDIFTVPFNVRLIVTIINGAVCRAKYGKQTNE